LKLKTALVLLFIYQTTPEGRKDITFKNLPLINDAEWIIIEGLSCIINPFKNVCNFLSGENSSTFTQPLPK
jgi:hypothetical protein